MIYKIKSIPTEYAGVNFRSRLEARWAAFFDLCGWKWDYEPFDLDGWAPDFLIKTEITDVLVEIKPLNLDDCTAVNSDTMAYDKACTQRSRYQVMLLGVSPVSNAATPGSILQPPDSAKYTWESIISLLAVRNTYDENTGEYFAAEDIWREAGNRVQWQSEKEYNSSLGASRIVKIAIENGLARAKAARAA